MTVGGKNVDLRTPAGWKITKGEDGKLTFTSATLSKPVVVTVNSIADSDPPGKALIKASGQSLEPFTKVAKREEKGPYPSRSGATVIRIYREGQAGTIARDTFDGV